MGTGIMEALGTEKCRCVSGVNEALMKAVNYINENNLSDDAVMHDAQRLASELEELCRKYRQACQAEEVFCSAASRRHERVYG